MKVYVLQHVHEADGEEDVKLLGVYSSSQAAREAIERFRTRPGFADAPDAFEIDEYTVDEDQWVEGYISWKDA
jgi:hypothetical protein